MNRTISHPDFGKKIFLRMQGNLLYLFSTHGSHHHLLTVTLQGELKKKVSLRNRCNLFTVSDEFIILMQQCPRSSLMCYIYTLELRFTCQWKRKLDFHEVFEQIGYHNRLIYASERSYHGFIQVFSLEGKRIAKLGYDSMFSPKQVKLRRPTGLFISVNYIYISDSDGVHVVQKDGIEDRFYPYKLGPPWQHIYQTEQFMYVSSQHGHYQLVRFELTVKEKD